MAEPTFTPDWNPPDGAPPGGNSVAPSSGKKLIGWLLDERPPAENFNWFWKLVSQWITHLKDFTNEIKAEGIADWITLTDYEIGNRVVFDFKIYESLTSHTSTADFLADLAAGNWKTITTPRFDPVVTVKVDGTVGFDTEFITITAALAAGHRNILLLKPQIFQATVISTSAVLTIGAHNISAGEFVMIHDSDSTPTINGTFFVASVTATTITLTTGITITVAGTTAKVARVLSDPVFINETHNGLVVAGEDNEFSGWMGTIAIKNAITASTTKVSFVTLRNIHFAQAGAFGVCVSGQDGIEFWKIIDCNFEFFVGGLTASHSIQHINISSIVQSKNLKIIRCKFGKAASKSCIIDTIEFVLIDSCEWQDQGASLQWEFGNSSNLLFVGNLFRGSFAELGVPVTLTSIKFLGNHFEGSADISDLDNPAMVFEGNTGPGAPTNVKQIQADMGTSGSGSSNFPASAIGTPPYIPLVGTDGATITVTAAGAGANLPIPGSENYPFKVRAISVKMDIEDLAVNDTVSLVMELPNGTTVEIAKIQVAGAAPDDIHLITEVTVPVHNYIAGTGQAQIRIFRLTGGDTTLVTYLGLHL